MNIVPWKKDLYGDDYVDEDEDEDNVTLDEMPMPVKIVEWDDET